MNIYIWTGCQMTSEISVKIYKSGTKFSALFTKKNREIGIGITHELHRLFTVIDIYQFIVSSMIYKK